MSYWTKRRRIQTKLEEDLKNIKERDVIDNLDISDEDPDS